MTSQDSETNIGGTATTRGQQMFLYGTGDRLRLERDVREGLARILFNQAMYDSQWTESLRVATGASAGVDARRRRPLRGAGSMPRARTASRRLPNRGLQAVDQAGLEAAVLGQAVWACGDIYGMPTIANVLYMTRITRSVKAGFAWPPDLLTTWPQVRAYHLRHAPRGYEASPLRWKAPARRMAERSVGDAIPMRLRRRFEYTHLPSPDGKHVAFTTNERGQLRVGTELESGKHTWHATLGHRLARLENDCIRAWRGTLRGAAFATELQSSHTWFGEHADRGVHPNCSKSTRSWT